MRAVRPSARRRAAAARVAPSFQSRFWKWFNGTEFTSIIFANSGYPVDLSAGADLNADLALNDRPLFAGRNAVLGPSFFQRDARLTRRFVLSERYTIQLIGETENFTNRLNPACTPEGGCSGAVVRLGSAAEFGRLTSARSARVFQFGARFQF